MAAARDQQQEQETEQGFGTGLRRQLERRRDEEEAQDEQHPDASKRPSEAWASERSTPLRNAPSSCAPSRSA